MTPEVLSAPSIDFASLDLLAYGVVVVDGSGRVLYYNAREEEIAGRSRDSVLGLNFFTEVAPCTNVREFHGRFLETMAQDGLVSNFPFRFKFPERSREVEITLTSFRNKGERFGIISVADVTEQMEVRQRILMAERLREVGEVAAGVAHNFNNVLGVVRANAQLLLMGAPAGDTRESLEDILKASNDGIRMVKRIMNAVREDPADQAMVGESLDISEVVHSSVGFTAHYAHEAKEKRGVLVSLKQDDVMIPLRITGVETELREVITNLLRNAVDAILIQGVVTTTIRAQGADVLIEVTDTGAGMPPEVMAKLFRPLFTTKGDQGTGLGLATSYAIIRRHRGKMTVRSQPGIGTTFTVQLPLEVTAAADGGSVEAATPLVSPARTARAPLPFSPRETPLNLAETH